MQTTQLKISGMNCGACVSHVTQALQDVPGVRAVKVDLRAGRATVQHEAAPPEAMTAAVAEAGYQAAVI